MTLQDIKARCEDGEVCIVESIEGMPPEDFIKKYPQYFVNYTVQDDIDKAGCLWILDNNIRNKKEYNP